MCACCCGKKKKKSLITQTSYLFVRLRSSACNCWSLSLPERGYHWITSCCFFFVCLFDFCLTSVIKLHNSHCPSDHRPQTTAGWVPENCAWAGGRERAEAAWLWQEAAAGQVQDWKCTGENARTQKPRWYQAIKTWTQKTNVLGYFEERFMCFMFQGEKECLNSETAELKQKIRYLQDQLLPLSKQREYQEKEIQRLNRVSEEQMRGLIP